MRPPLLAAIVVLAAASSGRADSWEPYGTQRYVSADGKHELVADETLTARFYTVGEPCTLVARFALPVLPRSAFVSGDGRRIALVDTYLENDEDSPGLILLDSAGQELRRYAIGELFDRESSERSVSSIWWYEGEGSGFSSDDRHFVLRRRGGTPLVFEVERGDRLDPAPGVPAATPSAEATPVVDRALLQHFAIDPSAQAALAALTDTLSVHPEEAAHMLRGHPQEEVSATLNARARHGDRVIDFRCPLHLRQGTLALEIDWEAWEENADRLVEALQGLQPRGVEADPVYLDDEGNASGKLRLTRRGWPLQVEAQIDLGSEAAACRPGLADLDWFAEALTVAGEKPEARPVQVSQVSDCFYATLPRAVGTTSATVVFDLATGILKVDERTVACLRPPYPHRVPEPVRLTLEKLEKPVDVDFRNATLADVCEHLRARHGLTIRVLDESESGAVVFCVRSLPLREILPLLFLMMDRRWGIDEQGAILVAAEEPPGACPAAPVRVRMATALAQEDGDETLADRNAAAAAELSERVKATPAAVDFHATPLAEAISSLAQSTGPVLSLDLEDFQAAGGPTEPTVDVKATGTLAEVLAQVAEQAGCTVLYHPNGIFVCSPAARDRREDELRQEEQAIAEILERPLTFDEPEIPGYALAAHIEKATQVPVIPVEEVWDLPDPLPTPTGTRPLGKALDVLCAQGGLRWRLHRGTIYVYR